MGSDTGANSGSNSGGSGAELCDLDATAQVAMVHNKEVSARELLAAHLARIDAVNPQLNAIVGMDASVAEAKAAAVDDAIAGGEAPGPLAGLVTATKDLVDTADFVTTHGSPVFADNRPAADALMVARLAEAGVVAVGKTNTPEFGTGSHTFNPVYGTTLNPYDKGRSAGGSSGGAAVAVRAGMVAIADGSDFGGSLRNPAAWNNVVGFRSSPRVVPRIGPGNAWNPMPIDGPMARSVDDLLLMFRVIAQPHIRDPLSAALDLPSVLEPPAAPLRVAWSSTLGGLPFESDVTEVLSRFRRDVEHLGWSVDDAEPDFSGADECFSILRALMYLRLDTDLGDRVSDLKATVQEEIERGRGLTSAQIAGAYAQLNVLWKRGIDFFSDYDLLIGPVTQVSPFTIDVEYPMEVNGVSMGSYTEWMRSCCRITAFGCPALSLPAGFTAAGMPVGAQLVGAPMADVGVLRAAKVLETATGHGTRGPDQA